MGLFDPFGAIGALGNGIAGAAHGVGNFLEGIGAGIAGGGGGGGSVATRTAAPKKKKVGASGDYVDPLQAAYDFAQQFGTSSGGSGGSGGGGGLDISGALGDAANRFGTQSDQLKQLYGQYADSLKGIAGQDKASYQDAINGAATGSKAIVDKTTANMKDQAAQTQQGLASLGVTGAAAVPTATEDATNKSLADIGSNNATWGNMEGVLSAAQQNNDNLDYTGAQSAGIEAQKSLDDAYNSYVAQLQQQAAAYASSNSGSGSSGSYSNPMLDMLNKGIMSNLISQGLGTGAYAPGKATFTPTKKQVSSTQKALVNAVSKYGSSPSKAQLSSYLTPTQLKTYTYLNK